MLLLDLLEKAVPVVHLRTSARGLSGACDRGIERLHAIRHSLTGTRTDDGARVVNAQPRKERIVDHDVPQGDVAVEHQSPRSQKIISLHFVTTHHGVRVRSHEARRAGEGREIGGMEWIGTRGTRGTRDRVLRVERRRSDAR